MAGWNDYADWSSVDTIRNNFSYNILGALLAAYKERSLGSSMPDSIKQLNLISPFINYCKASNLLSRYVNHTATLSGATTQPVWTVSAMEDALGESLIPAPSRPAELTAEWCYQQYKIFNLLRWYKGSVVGFDGTSRFGKSEDFDSDVSYSEMRDSAVSDWWELWSEWYGAGATSLLIAYRTNLLNPDWSLGAGSPDCTIFKTFHGVSSEGGLKSYIYAPYNLDDNYIADMDIYSLFRGIDSNSFLTNVVEGSSQKHVYNDYGYPDKSYFYEYWDGGYGAAENTFGFVRTFTAHEFDKDNPSNKKIEFEHSWPNFAPLPSYLPPASSLDVSTKGFTVGSYPYDPATSSFAVIKFDGDNGFQFKDW